MTDVVDFAMELEDIEMSMEEHDRLMECEEYLNNLTDDFARILETCEEYGDKFEGYDFEMMEEDVDLSQTDIMATEAMIDIVYSKLRQMVTTVSQYYYTAGIEMQKYCKTQKLSERNIDYMKNVSGQLRGINPKILDNIKINTVPYKELQNRMNAVADVFNTFASRKNLINMINAPIGNKDIRANKHGIYQRMYKSLSSVAGLKMNNEKFEKRKRGVKVPKRKVLFKWEFSSEFTGARKAGTFKTHGYTPKICESMAMFLSDIEGMTAAFPKIMDNDIPLISQIEVLKRKFYQRDPTHPGDALRFALCTYYIRVYDLVNAVIAATQVAKTTVADITRILNALKKVVK